jgi:hypothetical protein
LLEYSTSFEAVVTVFGLLFRSFGDRLGLKLKVSSQVLVQVLFENSSTSFTVFGTLSETPFRISTVHSGAETDDAVRDLPKVGVWVLFGTSFEM